MKSIQRYFKPTLADKYGELVTKESDMNEFLTSLMHEIKTELNESNSEAEKITSFNKVFLVSSVDAAHQRALSSPMVQFLGARVDII